MEVVLLNLTEVYKKISDANIELFSYDIPQIKAATIEINKKYGIFLNYNEIEDADDEFLVLAHEYGHCASGATHKITSKFETISRHEYRADRKSIIDFLPIEKIQQAIRYGCQTKYEFATFLGVPEDFVIKAFKHYTAMNLI